MANCCSVYGCSTTIKSGAVNNHKLYRFPRDKTLKEKWRHLLNLKDVYPNNRVCGLHFCDTDYIHTNLGWRVLTPGAVPSLNIKVPQENHISKGDPQNEGKLHKNPDTQEILEMPAFCEVILKKEIEEPDETAAAKKNCAEILEIAANHQESEDIYSELQLSEGRGTAAQQNFRSLKYPSQEKLIRSVVVQSPAAKRRKINFKYFNEDDETTNLVCGEVLKPSPKLQCSQCNKEFSERLVLLMHMTLHYKSGKSICGKCGKMFSNPQSYKNHIRSPCNYELGVNTPTVDNVKHSASEHFICTLCGQVFGLLSEVYDHCRIFHVRGGTNVCITCKFVSKTTAHAEQHFKETHLKNSLICIQCKRLFHSMAEMWIHKEDLQHGLHLECPECCERFSSMSHLLAHIKSHTCISFFSCEFCQLIFTSIECVEAHILNHISAGDNKVVRCIFCKDGNASKQSRHLQYHSHSYMSRKSPSLPSTSKDVKNIPSKLPVEIKTPHTYVSPSCHNNRNDLEVNAPQLQVKIEAPHSDKFTVSSAAAFPSKTPQECSLDSDIELKCDDCDEVFTNESQMSSHLQIHQSRGDFSCIECGVQCNSFKALTTHYQEHVKLEESGDGNWTSDEEN